MNTPNTNGNARTTMLYRRFNVPAVSAKGVVHRTLGGNARVNLGTGSFVSRNGLIPSRMMVNVMGRELSTSSYGGNFVLSNFPEAVPRTRTLSGVNIRVRRIVGVSVSSRGVVGHVSKHHIYRGYNEPFRVIALGPGGRNIYSSYNNALIRHGSSRPSAILTHLRACRGRARPLISCCRGRNGLIAMGKRSSMRTAAGTVLRNVRTWFVIMIGATQRLSGVGSTYEVSTRTLHITKRTMGPNIAACRVSGVIHSCVRGRKTIPSFLNCNNFPTDIYVSIGGIIVRNVPDGRLILGRNSVMDISINTFCKKFRNSGTFAFPYNGVDTSTRTLLSTAGRDLCRKVGRTLTFGHINSVNGTIRGCIRTHDCSIMQSFINRNMNTGLRRSPDMPGCNATREKIQLVPNVAVTVRPVIGRNEYGIHILSSG